MQEFGKTVSVSGYDPTLGVINDKQKRFWDDCIEYEVMVMSHTAHPLYALKGEVPETVMQGSTSDISLYAELMWYEFVYRR